MSTGSTAPQAAGRLDAGTRLICSQCKAEVEIIQPCGCNPPDMVLSCCGREMTPTPGKSVHIGVE